ncbi:Oxygen-dependent choline dehydrogenase [Mycena sanguinolenta]|uniref:Oxygen-dependent choline dehydrogenase n=1 Tax=Mycena sanguinolenta TaxID=230812 RepID=A0A8H6ZE23_9AGAR|nr:Oxygen-dependent choline dehydrogenase [Mycena sanguinolenta]
MIYERYEDLPTRSYDFVIVGGGNAGVVLANRLSENAEVSVLLLEAGGAYENAHMAHIPFLCTMLGDTEVDWGYKLTPQAALDGRVVPYPRGFVLGGSSAINYMACTRGSAEDYDRFAKVTGDDGWSWKSLLPYFHKSEKYTVVDSRDATEYDATHHSTAGLHHIGLPMAQRDLDQKVIRSLSDEFPFNSSINSGKPIGFGATIFDELCANLIYPFSCAKDGSPVSVKGGARNSAASSYLAQAYLARPNLHVLVKAHVTRVLQTGTSDAGPVFRGVEFVQKGDVSVKHTVTAAKEVVLSAGAVGTPAILLHSGIGDTKVLEGLGIKSTLNLPDVGQNLSEHTLSAISWEVNSTNTFEAFTRDPAGREAAEKEWRESKTGPLSTPPCTQIGFLRLPESLSILATTADPAAGPNTPHMELLFLNGFLGPPPPTGNYLTVAFACVTPTSLGSVTLASNDPLAAPLIDPKLLGTEIDRVTMREAFKAARKFVTGPGFKDYIIRELSAEVPDTDEGIDAYLRATTAVVFHPTGTAKMSAKDAKDGVVNPDLLVKGAVGLRVVDASVFPFIPSAHTMLPVYALAERASDLIKAEHKI